MFNINCHAFAFYSHAFWLTPFCGAGRLGHLHGGEGGVSMAKMQRALHASFEREAAHQNMSLHQRSQGIPHAPFRFRMYFKDFMALFRCVVFM